MFEQCRSVYFPGYVFIICPWNFSSGEAVKKMSQNKSPARNCFFFYGGNCSKFYLATAAGQKALSKTSCSGKYINEMVRSDTVVHVVTAEALEHQHKEKKTLPS